MEKYEQIKEIGKGNYGKAILVKNLEDNNFYVMKLIEISNFTREQLETALYEVNVIKKLKHPFIITYIESFYDELKVSKENTNTFEVKFGKRREDIILNWFVQLCFAVKYIHDKKILHRDLKSSNIFICSNGNIKLGDFGIAKVLKNTNEFAKTIVGTPYYLSPEICLRKPYNQKSDIWSMGCILFELMNLRHAFEGENIGELIIKILKGNFEPLNPVYSVELRDLVKDILNINCELRPDLNTILEKKFLLHYIKLTLIRQITSNSKRKLKQPEIIENKSVGKRKKSIDKKEKLTNSKSSNNNGFAKLNQININKNNPSYNNSSKSNERILIDNSTTNSKFKKVSNIAVYKSSSIPSENNSFNNKSHSKSKSNDNNLSRVSNNNYHRPKPSQSYKMSSVDERINNIFNKIAEKKNRKKPNVLNMENKTPSKEDLTNTPKIDKNDEKSVFTKIEKLKTYLEKILGLEIFMDLYFKINDIYSKKNSLSFNDIDFSSYKITNETTKKQVIKLIKSLIKLENKLYK